MYCLFIIIVIIIIIIFIYLLPQLQQLQFFFPQLSYRRMNKVWFVCLLGKSHCNMIVMV